jgi:hypothetical protein
MENIRENSPENQPQRESGANRNPAEESNKNTSQNAREDDDPSTWPSGDKSLEELIKEDENRRDTRIEGDNSNAGKGTTIGNP